MSTTLLILGVAAGGVQLALTGWAALDGERRPWPPEKLSAGFGLYWLLVVGMAVSFFGSLVTGHGSLYPVGVVSLSVGGAVFVAGAAVNVLVADEMDEPTEILGLEWRLHTTGPFRVSRNPAVAGHVGAVGGLAVASGGWQALVIATLVVAWFVLRPVADERVLEVRFGERYARYRAEVDRYVDRDRLREALDRS